MKKMISILVTIIMVSGIFTTVNAANELAGAKNYTLGAEKSGKITESVSSNVYFFELSSAGRLDLNLNGEIEAIALKLYDENGKEIWASTPSWNSTTEEISYENTIYLNKGKYYFSASQANSWYPKYGTYTFKLRETSVYETFIEGEGGTNNTTKTSNNITHGTEIIGLISINDDVDIYNFNLATAGKLDLNLNGEIKAIALKLYDENGKEIWASTPSWNSTTEEISYENTFYLNKGKYYFSASQANSWYPCYGDYSFKFLFTSANESFAEEQNGSNNNIKSANIIAINHAYNGMIALNDDVDLYRIVVDDYTDITFNLTGEIQNIALKLYNENGKEIWNKTPSWNNTTEEINYQNTFNLDAGLYYFSASQANSWYPKHGTYYFYFTDGGTVIDPPAPNSTISVHINGNLVQFDQPPILENGRTLVPLRAIFEALGADVQWNDNTQTVTATKSGTQISLQIGSTKMYVNGSIETLDVPAKLINSRTLVPVRAISEAFGCKVDWVQDTQTVVITQ